MVLLINNSWKRCNCVRGVGFHEPALAGKLMTIDNGEGLAATLDVQRSVRVVCIDLGVVAMTTVLPVAIYVMTHVTNVKVGLNNSVIDIASRAIQGLNKNTSAIIKSARL